MNWIKKFFLSSLLCLVPVFAQAQIDINIFPGHQPYVQLGKNLVWGSSGVGAANNYFIFSPLNPDQRYCGFIVNNNPTTAHSYTLSAWQTGDPNQSTFLNNASGRWIQDTVQGNSGIVGAGATTTFYVHANAGARFAISLTGATTQAGSPDTLDFFVVQTTGDSCGPVQQGQSASTTPILCDKTTFVQVGSGGNTQMVAAVTGQKIYVCAYSFNLETTPTLSYANMSLNYGTGAVCATGLTELWAVWFNINAAGPANASLGSGTGALFSTPPSNALCASNGLNIVTKFSITYAQF